MVAETIRYTYRPSALARAKLCPGSVALSHGFPETSSAAADEGTLLHERVVSGDLSDLDAEQVEAVTAAREYAEILCEGAGTNFFEHRIVKQLSGGIKLGGTIDRLAIFGSTARVIDYKFGRSEVSQSFATAQLTTYCYLVMRFNPDFEKVEGFVYSPRGGYEYTLEITKEELPSILEGILSIIRAAEKPDAPLYASYEACCYCPAIRVCKAAGSRFDLALAGGDFDPEPDNIDGYIDAAKIAEKVAQARISAGKDWIIEHGGETDSWKVVSIAKRRFTGSTPEIVKSLMENGADLDAALQCARMSVTQAETLYVDVWKKDAEHKGVKVTKKSLKEKFKKSMGVLLGMTDGSLSLRKKG